MFEFRLPWLLFIILLPLITTLILPKANSPKSAALKVPFFNYLADKFGSHSQSDKHSLFSRILAFICWSLLVISASGPMYVSKPIPIPTEGRSIMMAIDLSGSMREQDMVVNGRAYSRFDVVKAIASQFIDDRKGDRVGLILFGSKAYLRSPLTPDVGTVSQLLEKAIPGLAGEKTAIGDSIGLAIKNLIESPKANRVLILMTDGRNNAGNINPIKAAEMAKLSDIRIYTIGLGSSRQNIWSQNNGPDNKSLKEIADMTGGKFFYAGNVEQLKQVYQSLDELETSKDKPQYYRTSLQLYPYPLAAALIITFLMALMTIINKRIFRRS
jgi:Ca-activated chloride channel family protein